MNLVAYRIINNYSIIKPRSFCPNCKKQIRWFENVPVFSYVFLGGFCSECKLKISFLYPLIELLTASLLTYIFLNISSKYLFAYFIYLSCMIVSIRTDWQYMLISRYCTLFIIPVALVLSYIGLLDISFYNSLTGSIFGYFILWATAKIFYYFKKQEGMGQGDLELLATIGAFTGIVGAWAALLIGSLLGSFFGLIFAFKIQQFKNIKIPFGPFLIAGSILYLLKFKHLFNYLILYS